MKPLVTSTLLLVCLSCSNIDSPTPTQPQNQQATLSITSTPNGAQIWIDGTATGNLAPSSVAVPSGTHSVRLVLLGYHDWTQQVSAIAGQTTQVNATLTLAGILEEFFENGLSQWSLGSNWYISSDTSYEGNHAINFRQPIPFANQGGVYTYISSITLLQGFSLSNTQTAYLRMWHLKGLGNHTVVPTGYYDTGIGLKIEISLDGGTSWAFLGFSEGARTWTRYEKNLSSYIGPGSTNVKIRISIGYDTNLLGVLPIDMVNLYIDAITVTSQ